MVVKRAAGSLRASPICVGTIVSHVLSLRPLLGTSPPILPNSISNLILISPFCGPIKIYVAYTYVHSLFINACSIVRQ
jgi:hypothetical protein